MLTGSGTTPDLVEHGRGHRVEHATSPGAPVPPGLALRRIRRQGYLGPVHPMQLLLVEAAVVATVALGIRQVWTQAAAAAAGALVTAAICLLRYRGRWAFEALLLRARLRRRVRWHPSRSPASADDPRVSAVRWLAPEFVVTDVDGPAGSRIGVGYDGAGWYAVAALDPTAPMRDDAGGGPRLDSLVRILADARQPGAVVQLVTSCVPAGSGSIAPTSPAATSYRQLLEGYGAVPLIRSSWLAVRLDARMLAEDDDSGEADTRQAPIVVAAMLVRLVKAAGRAGHGYRLLDIDGLLTAVVTGCGLDQVGDATAGAAPPAGPPAAAGAAPAAGPPARLPARPREEWQALHVGDRRHTCFWVRGWPPATGLGTLLTKLSSVPASKITLALTANPAGDGAHLRCLLRVTAAPDRLTQVCASLATLARSAGADLLQLDGEQAPAAYASGPTGGGGG